MAFKETPREDKISELYETIMRKLSEGYEDQEDECSCDGEEIDLDSMDLLDKVTEVTDMTLNSILQGDLGIENAAELLQLVDAVRRIRDMHNA